MSIFFIRAYITAEIADASTSEARAIVTASYAGIPTKVRSIGAIIKAADSPAIPVPTPAPIPAST